MDSHDTFRKVQPAQPAAPVKATQVDMVASVRTGWPPSMA